MILLRLEGGALINWLQRYHEQPVAHLVTPINDDSPGRVHTSVMNSAMTIASLLVLWPFTRTLRHGRYFKTDDRDNIPNTCESELP